MRRLMCMMLCVIMLLSLGTPALAGDDGLPAAVAETVAMLDIPDQYEECAGERKYLEYNDTYRFVWFDSDGNKISASVISNGQLLSYSDDMARRSGRTNAADLNNMECRAVIEEFIGRMYPQLTAELHIKRIEPGMWYEVFYERKIDNIPVFFDNITISVDRYTGRIEEVSAQWTYYDRITPVKNLFSFEKAKETLEKMIELSLCEVGFKYGERPAVYTLSNIGEYFMVDAITGRKYNSGYGYGMGSAVRFSLTEIETTASINISKKKAKELYVNANSPGLCYVKNEHEGQNGEKLVELVLVYTLLDNEFFKTCIDAENGEALEGYTFQPKFATPKINVDYRKLFNSLCAFFLSKNLTETAAGLSDSIVVTYPRREYDIRNFMNA